MRTPSDPETDAVPPPAPRKGRGRRASARKEPPALRPGKVSRLAPQKRHPDRVSVYIDGAFAFGLSQDVVLTHGLSLGQHLSVEAQQALIEASALVQARVKALEYISYKPRTEREVRDRLLDKGFAPPVITLAVDRLKELGYIDDARFASAFVRDRLEHRGHGRRRIARDLERRGVDPDRVAREVEAIEEDTARAAALDVAARRWERVRDEPDPRKRRQKMYAFLARRGFASEVVRAVLDALPDPAPSDATADPDPAPRRASARRDDAPDEAALEEAARKRWRRLLGEPDASKRERKILDHLRRKGASFTLARALLDRVAADPPLDPLAGLGGPAPTAAPAEDDTEAQQLEEARDLARKRADVLSRLESNPRKRRSKLHAYLSRRHIPGDLIRRVMDELPD